MSGYTKERLRCRLSSGRYRSTVSEPQLQIRGDCPQVEAMGNVHNIQAPWERMTAPRYNEYKVGPKHGW